MVLQQCIDDRNRGQSPIILWSGHIPIELPSEPFAFCHLTPPKTIVAPFRGVRKIGFSTHRRAGEDFALDPANRGAVFPPPHPAAQGADAVLKKFPF